ncbi:hypothetical protein [Acetobacter indonesiensis]|uniref:Uncharacterized protein n=1 Tax=Acetobacter indonesiensis TaxID=104101 RepID=A0A252ANJ2_9PROT|nr:hypothetical protein [Acetobacter indonesiensis]OUI91424.1 hypothetical protein HK17_11560 [Acetobacter indonesiensis]
MSILTSSITPGMVPGIRKAIEVCEEFGRENRRISHDEICVACQTKETVTVADMDQSVIHTAKCHAAFQIASLLRALVGEGDAA